MTEPWLSESLNQQTRLGTPPENTEIAHGSLGPREIRIDAAHHSSAVKPPRRETQLLLEATQAVQRLHAELASLDERESELDEREAQLAQQRRDLEAWSADVRAELEQRASSLQAQQRSLADRLQSVETQTAALAADRAALAIEREQLREIAAQELEDERNILLLNQSELLDASTEFELMRAEWHAAQQQLEQDAAEELQRERLSLQQALADEWQQRCQTLDQERLLWDATRRAADHDLHRQRVQYEAALSGLETELTARRERFEAEFSVLRQQAEAELAERQAAWQQTHATVEGELQRERQLAESRLRFQHEHLEKTRQDLERSQQELRAERQSTRQQLETDAVLLRQRADQLELYRESLDEQAKSLDREREALARMREGWSSTSEEIRRSVQAEQEAWAIQREREQEDLQRRQSHLARHVESLESKRIRLDRLRRELEDTHRSTLELRMAVEDAWAQIAHSTGDEDEARMRIEASRQSLSSYYEHLHAALAEQRRELVEAIVQFDQQRIEFQTERQTLLTWFHDRDEHLRIEEVRQRRQVNEMATREAAWQTARDRWLGEKLEAEAVIRRLLTELGERHRSRIFGDGPMEEPASILPAPHFHLSADSVIRD